ncbi:MAG: hypothetical protein QOH93_3630 [Chloroflexia bacterium]|jgi:hypothetical protein|nr:hypothetical protein [Chloroflexia bacterium]
MFDVSPLVPEAQPIAAAAARVYWQHTKPWCLGLLVHGSAYKGGFIPGCSDIDMQLFLQNSAFDASSNIPLEIAAAIQADLSKIDPAPFQYIQCYTLPEQSQAGGPGSDYILVPGTYHVLEGRIPMPEATAEQVRAKATDYMEKLQPDALTNANHLLQHGGGRLERHVRLLCTNVWPTLYSLLACTAAEPIKVWQLPKQEAIALMRLDDAAGRQIRAFYESVWTYYGGSRTVDAALELYKAGSAFIYAAKDQYLRQTGRATT